MVRAEAAARLRLLSVGRPLTWLDVFTAEPLAGNQLAVVHDADGLADETMLAFARETKLSETTFVQPADAAGADYRNRIFMGVGELGFAGHPSLGTAVAVAAAAGLDAASYVQQTEAGTQPIDVERDGDIWRASMLQGPARLGAEVDPAPVLAAAGLPPGTEHPELPCQIASTGTAQLLAPVRDRAALEQARPDVPRLTALLAEHGATTLYLVAVDGTEARARSFFADVHGATEDPATGSAAGPLCAYLGARGVTDRVTIRQGVEMGRPSVLACAVEGEHVRVAGDCVVVATGTVTL